MPSDVRACGVISINAWPGGPRRVGCLACERSFLSRSKAERLCVPCRAGRSAWTDRGPEVDSPLAQDYRPAA
jgi:hypothetical protein